jgi:hypothetical protein
MIRWVGFGATLEKDEENVIGDEGIDFIRQGKCATSKVMVFEGQVDLNYVVRGVK